MFTLYRNDYFAYKMINGDTVESISKTREYNINPSSLGDDIQPVILSLHSDSDNDTNNIFDFFYNSSI